MGFAGEKLGDSSRACSVCHGVALALSLPDRDLVLSLPFYVDFSGRVKSLLYKIFLLLLSSVFIFGVPYLIYIYVLEFIHGLNRL